MIEPQPDMYVDSSRASVNTSTPSSDRHRKTGHHASALSQVRGVGLALEPQRPRPAVAERGRWKSGTAGCNQDDEDGRPQQTALERRGLPPGAHLVRESLLIDSLQVRRLVCDRQLLFGW
jgi:hypothetical protein